MWLLINPIYGVNIRTILGFSKPFRISRRKSPHLERLRMRIFMNTVFTSISLVDGRGLVACRKGVNTHHTSINIPPYTFSTYYVLIMVGGLHLVVVSYPLVDDLIIPLPVVIPLTVAGIIIVVAPIFPIYPIFISTAWFFRSGLVHFRICFT